MFVNPKLILFYELKTNTLGTETTFNIFHQLIIKLHTDYRN